MLVAPKSMSKCCINCICALPWDTVPHYVIVCIVADFRSNRFKTKRDSIEKISVKVSLQGASCQIYDGFPAYVFGMIFLYFQINPYSIINSNKWVLNTSSRDQAISDFHKELPFT